MSAAGGAASGGDGAGNRRGPVIAGAVAQVFVADLHEPELSAEDAHHLARVLRLRPGEPVVASDGEGGWRLCRYMAGSRPAVAGVPAGELEVDGPIECEPPVAQPVTVGFVPVKGDRPEWVVQKLTEIGVDHIVVLRSGRAVVRWEGERAERALDRFLRVAREAAAQSRRVRLPAIDGPWSLAEMAAAVSPQPAALADAAGAPPPGDLRCLAVGPEGGWAEGEGAGLTRVSLGDGILRSETAALAAATLLCALRGGVVGPVIHRQSGVPAHPVTGE